MFHPMVAGVTIPGMGLFVLILAPYIDSNPSNKPEDRKFAHLADDDPPRCSGRCSVIIGSFFRGPGFNFTLPWQRRHLLRAAEDGRSTSTKMPSPSSSSSPSWLSPGSPRSLPSPAAATCAARGRAVARDASATSGRPRRGRRARAADRRARSSGSPSPKRAGAHEPAKRHPAGAVHPARPRGRRRQPPPVLQPGATSITLMTRRARRLRRRRRRLPVAERQRRLRLQGQRRQARRRLLTQINANDNFLYLPEARTWLTRLPGRRRCRRPRARMPASRPCSAAWRPASSPSTRSARTSAAAPGVRQTSQWFECPCHGSQYNRAGEKKGGPAPRGMDRFGVDTLGGGNVVIDTGAVYQRPADRHQHHRPRGRGSPLHHRACLLDARRWGNDQHGLDHRRDLHAGLGRVLLLSTATASKAEIGSEIELAPEPQAVLRRRRARRPAPRCVAVPRRAPAGDDGRRPAAVLDPRAGPPGSQDPPAGTSSSRPGARTCSRTTADGGLQLRRLPRRHEGHRRRRASTCSPTRTPVDVTAGRRGRHPPSNTVLYRFDASEVDVHHHLRPVRHADVRLGHRRRRGR